MPKSPRILVAPLNWGLGHATRCIPIIHALQKQGAEVLIGSDGAALKLLRLTFPELPFIELPAYNIRYRQSNMFMNIATQLPKLFRVLKLERRFLAPIIQDHKIDALISDNRYGLSTHAIPTAFITHQLNIRISNPLIRNWINRMNRHLIARFSECWIPDFEEEPNLSGELGHGSKITALRYIGPLSRLETPNIDRLQMPYDIVVLLSGPEPQRSYFERKLLEQLSLLPLHSLLVRGNPGLEGAVEYHGSVEIRPYLNAEEVALHLSSCRLFIARSGYSTIMDMAKVGYRSALLIPTPGQTEQEYLAEGLAKSGHCLVQTQKKLDVRTAWEKTIAANGFAPNAFQHSFNSNLLEKAVLAFLNRIK